MKDYYEFLDQECDNYESLSDILKNNSTTVEEIKTEIQYFRDKFRLLAENYYLDLRNPVKMYLDVIEKIADDSDNPELHYIYICLVSDYRVLNNINTEDNDDEQLIRNYLNQKNLVAKYSELLQSHRKCSEKLIKLKSKSFRESACSFVDYRDDVDSICALAEQYDFLKNSENSEIFRDNINALLMKIYSDKDLEALMPYLLYAVLTRKNGMIQNRENYSPNITSALQYQSYNITSDNGKNFNCYQDYIAFYYDIRELYKGKEATDNEFCDFCFAYLSPLSEWYYTQCERDTDIPMMISRYIYLTNSLEFPMLYSYSDLYHTDYSEFEEKRPDLSKLWNEMITEELIHEFISILYDEDSISDICSILPEYEEYPEYARLLFYTNAEILIEYSMLDASLNFINI